MDSSAASAGSGDNSPSRWSDDQAIELWKYFAGVGAQDKNTMVTVGALLLGFSAALMGILVDKDLLKFESLSIAEPGKTFSLAILGIVISCVAAYISLLYGGYSNWNWAKADAIARDRMKVNPNWAELLPPKSKETVEQGTTGTPSCFAAIAARFGKPCDPIIELAPIFTLYTWLALGAVLLHGFVLFLSLCKLTG